MAAMITLNPAESIQVTGIALVSVATAFLLITSYAIWRFEGLLRNIAAVMNMWGPQTKPAVLEAMIKASLVCCACCRLEYIGERCPRCGTKETTTL